MTVRYTPPMVGSVIVTFGLFFLMQLLVAGQAVDLPPELPKMDWMTASQIMPEPEPVTPDLPDRPPEVMDPPTVPTGPGVPMVPGEYVEEILPAGPGTGIASIDRESGANRNDGDMVPLYIIPPDYPIGARQRGTEGSVTLEFTVDERGSVLSPAIVYSEPDGVFDGAALKAIRKSKFKPRIIDGKAMSVHGVRYKYSFKLEN